MKVVAARVVPAVPTFATDAGFWYAAPDEVEVGTVVRVPLGGRRVRGYVVEIVGRSPRPELLPIGPRVMNIRVFDRPLLEALTWAAHRYVAPIAVLLERATPPNLANRGLPPGPRSQEPPVDHPLREYAEALAAGARRPPMAFLTRAGDVSWLEALARTIIGNGRSLMVVAATGAEAGSLAETAARRFADQLVVVQPETSAAETTAAWVRCQSAGHLLIGTPRVAGWPMAGLLLTVAVEEGRRAMKDRQTPTVAVRDLLRIRASLAGTGVAFVGPTPSLETIGAGATILRSRPRMWPPVEIVDRNQEPETPGLLGGTALSAMKAVLERNGRIFVFAHRRGYAAAARCRRCRTLRRCWNCGARPESSPTCARCEAVLGACSNCGHDQFQPLGAGVGRVLEEVQRRFGSRAAAAPGAGPIRVGSEADLASLASVDLAVAVDADGLILGSNYRAGEEALRILVRLVGKVAGPSSRGMIQTAIPNHPVFQALRKGDPIPFIENEMEERRRLGFPPAGQLLVVELRGPVPPAADSQLRQLKAEVIGPAIRDQHHRWLLQGDDLTNARQSLRPLVQRWRDGGTTVRIDADPLDL